MTICTRNLLAGVAFAPVAIAAFVAPAQAQVQAQAQAQAARDFNIPGGTLDAALMTYARQAGVQILYTADLVAGLRTAGLTGRHEPGAALDRLLAGSGVVWSRSRPGVIVLRRASSPQASVEAVELGEVLVTGSLIRGPSETASPVVSLSAAEMDRAGHGSVADALQALPQTFGGTATPTTFLTASDAGGSNTTLATGVDLRGLGPDSTLVLVNGRRLAGAGSRGEFADLSSLPNAAVERVDILLDGASALYGSDAVGDACPLRPDRRGAQRPGAWVRSTASAGLRAGSPDRRREPSVLGHRLQRRQSCAVGRLPESQRAARPGAPL